MKKENRIKNIENYEKLYEDLKIRYQYKDKENQQLKALVKSKDKEIMSLKKKIKLKSDNINYINSNNLNEISQKYIADLIKVEIENIQKEQLLYRNKILTIETYELQYLAPKLTTGNNHNFQFSSHQLIKKGFDNNVENIYYNINSEIKTKNRAISTQKRKKAKYELKGGIYYKYKLLDKYENMDNITLNGSFSKILTKSKQKLDV